MMERIGYTGVIRTLRMAFLLVLLIHPSYILAQQTVNISGRVTDMSTGEPMAGVNISIPSLFKGTVTNNDGYFFLQVSGVELPVSIRVSMVGYRTVDYEITRTYESGLRIRMTGEDVVTGEVVVTAPVMEVEQKVFREALSVEMMDALSIRETPAHNYYQALAYLKGVDVTTQSLQFLSVNARGFNSTENLRFKQVVDGMDNQAPGFNFPIGNILGLNELDVESMEFLPGPSSVIFGNNALNGILELKGKDPFMNQGLSVMVKPGVADIRPGNDYPFQFYGKPLIDASIRYAKAYGNLGYKFTASFMRGRDWYADDTTNIREGHETDVWDPGHDGLNQYGDEVVAMLAVGENGEMIPVSRTGYKDKYLVDNKVKNLKLGTAVHYKITDKMTAVLSGHYGLATTAYTGDNRIALSNFGIFQAKTELQGDHLLLRAYTTRQYSGDTYDTRFLAMHLNRYAKSDEQWFREYENAYLGKYARFGIIGYDHGVARAVADDIRLVPQTAPFEEVARQLIDSTDFSRGARLVNNSSLYETDGQYLIRGEGMLPDILIGASYRFFDLESEGTIFPDTTGNDITYYEYGSFVELSGKMMKEKLDLAASLRYDRSENFPGVVTPRFSALYSFSEYNNLRFSILTGARFPGTKEQFIRHDLGESYMVGGLREMFTPFNLPGNAFYYETVKRFKQAVDTAMYGTGARVTRNQAIIQNLPLLEGGTVEEGDFTGLKPEKVLSIEMGYKSRVTNSLFFDLIYYYSTYRDFIGYVPLVKPRTSPSVDLFNAASQLDNSSQRDVLYVYSNSHEHISLQGFIFGMKWMMPIGSIFSLNATITDINRNPDDPIVPGFNTPFLKVNLSIANRKLDKMPNNPGFKNVGYNLNWRYQSPVDWESPYASGKIDQFATTDFQLSYTFQKPKSVLKAGVNNFLNILHTTSYGGPQVGIFYYVSYTMEALFD